MWDLHFHKYQGTGNDFIIIDDRAGNIQSRLTAREISWLCHRRFGIGADGLMLLKQHARADFRMIYYNADGQESTMCGNGGRCLVHFAHRQGQIGAETAFEAIDGYHLAILEESQVRLKMGTPIGYRRENASRDWLDTGSPHLIEWIAQDSLQAVDVQARGSLLRYDQRYAPGGVNVNFVRETADNELEVRTYERGVEGETYSCGTGVTACAYAYLIRNEKTSGCVHIHTQGGPLSVEIYQRGGENEEVWLSGPATFVYSGTVTMR